MGRSIFLVVTLLLFAGCGDDHKPAEPSAETTDTAPATGASTRPAVDRCRPFSIEMAEELISNSDTGERKIAGPITATAAVQSEEMTGTGRSLWFISINVGGTVVTLAHDTARGDPPEGAGLFSAVDQVSEDATSFPRTPRLKASPATDGARESQACVR